MLIHKIARHTLADKMVPAPAFHVIPLRIFMANFTAFSRFNERAGENIIRGRRPSMSMKRKQCEG